MDKETVWNVLRGQLALDLGCDVSLLSDDKSYVIPWKNCDGRRRYNADIPMLEVAILNGKVIVSCGEALYPWAKAHFPTDYPEWVFSPSVFRLLEDALAPLGYELASSHHFYLPRVPCESAAPITQVRWYEQDQLEQFRDDPDWNHALAFGEYSPDVLAVAAVDTHGAPMAMAACSMDGARLWQIGVNVRPEHRGKGLAINLTALLKDEVLRRGAVPFYGTAESHIASQNVALKAGFYPAFAYLYARPKKGVPHG